MGRGARSGSAKSAGTAVLAAMGLLAVVTAATPSAAQENPEADQRVVELRAEYRIEPDQGLVDVVEEIIVSNVRGSTRSGSVVTSYFWTGHTIWVPADAEDLSIEVGGQPLAHEVAATIEGVDVISADYRRNLNFGQTRVIDVTYTLPTDPPGEGDRRINGAFFDLELFTCCNFESVDLTVSVPSSFEVDAPIDLPFERRSVGDRQEFTFEDSEERTGRFTELILASWSGLDEAGFETTPIDAGGGLASIVAPPDDTAWSVDVVELVGGVAAELVELTGSPEALDGVEFRQGADGNFDRWGSDGPYDATIAVPRPYDDVALAITVAKIWLRDGPFDDIDIERGLAADLGAEALRRATGTETTPSAPTDTGLGDLVTDEEAFWVVRQVSDEVGYDAMRSLLQMAVEGETAYVGDGEPERHGAAPNDWRRFVDLAERRLGSEVVADLFVEHIVDTDGAALVERRADALVDYEEVVERGDGIAPLGIRTEMSNWDFEAAEELLATAEDVLAERERVVELAESNGRDAAVPLGEGWASARSVEDLEAVRVQLLERERDINSSSLARRLLIAGGVVVALGGFGAAVSVLNRRNKQVESVEVDDVDPDVRPVSFQMPASASVETPPRSSSPPGFGPPPTSPPMAPPSSPPTGQE